MLNDGGLARAGGCRKNNGLAHVYQLAGFNSGPDLLHKIEWNPLAVQFGLEQILYSNFLFAKLPALAICTLGNEGFIEQFFFVRGLAVDYLFDDIAFEFVRSTTCLFTTFRITVFFYHIS